jgi:flavin reductase (DIM6/NTAB) family NADH-FMN oxidoreductase RutF
VTSDAGVSSIQERQLVELMPDAPVWDRIFTVAPLVLVGTKEGDSYDVAPKHLATPIGRQNYFGFVCTERHATYRNVLAHPEFTVSFPRADRIIQTTLAAGERFEDGSKPTLAAVPTFPAQRVDGVLVEGCYLYLECELDRIIDGFGEDSLIVGRVVGARARRDYVRNADVDDADLLHRLSPIAYLAPGRFGIVRETYCLPLPIGFRR